VWGGAAGARQKGIDMATWWDGIKATFAALGVPADNKTKAGLAAAGVAVDEEVAGTVSFDADTGADAEKDALKAELAKLRAEAVQKRAAAFADEMIRDRRALPAEKDALTAAFAQAVSDDDAHGTATFADGKGRVDTLTAMVKARPQHALTDEMLKTSEEAALFANRQQTDTEGKRLSAEAKAKLMGMTPLGRECLKGKGN
jgi:hypothetical protein